VGGSSASRTSAAAVDFGALVPILLYMTSEVLRQSISFHLHPSSGVPAYRQLEQQVRQALRMGTLRIGDKLPTVKEVVAEVAINPNTVMKAYRGLELEGLVEGRQGVGTFVVRLPDGPPPDVLSRLSRSLAHWVLSARQDGLDDESIESMLRGILGRSRESRIA
jgi:GntR family transcriptional regulator